MKSVVPHILNVPDEVLVSIMSYLDPTSLDVCAQVSQRFYRIMNNSLVLKYHRALIIAGFVDVSNRYAGAQSTTLVDRFRRLKAHENAWRTLQWKKKATLPLEGSFGAYELNGGIFAYSSRDNESISFTILSSVTDGMEDQVISWVNRLEPLDVVDFTFSSDFNLLCLIERSYRRTQSPYTIHLRTVNSNVPHPEARIPILSCPEECFPYFPSEIDDSQVAFTIQVYADLLLCLFQLNPYGGDDMGIIWNWRTGVAVKIIHPEPNRQARYTDVTFLSSHSILLCVLFENQPAALKIISWDKSAAETSTTLYLPTLNPTYMYARLQYHSNPGPSGTQNTTRPSALPTNRTLVVNDDDRLLSFSCYIRRQTPPDGAANQILDDGEGMYCLLFLSQKSLPQFPAGELQWNEWRGPELSRWIPHARTYGWAVCSRGMRFVCTAVADVEFDFALNSRIMLLDFNVTSASFMPLAQNARLVSDKEVLRDDLGIFTSPVESSLPYIEVVSEEWVSDSLGFMMDEEMVVSMKVAEQDIVALDIMTFSGTRTGTRGSDHQRLGSGGLSIG